MKEEIVKSIKEEALDNNVPIIRDETLNIIINNIIENKTNNILEIGTAVGYSSLSFIMKMKSSSMVTTIERDKEMYNKAIVNFLKVGKEVEESDKNIRCFEIDNKYINIINADAVEILPRLNSKFDMIFIDANKSKYPFYLEQGLRLLSKNGTIFADNVLFKGMVLSDYNEHKHRTNVRNLREFLKMLKENENITYQILDLDDGLAVIKFI